jgi:hypothetical protein
MDDVKRKVLLDLFVSPWTVLPTAGGLTALIAAWAAAGNPTLIMAGLAGLLVGAGMFASRLIVGLDKITQEAYQYFLAKKHQERETALDRLHERLVTDRDPRTENCLAELRLLYGSLQRAHEEGKISRTSYEIVAHVGKIFEQCVQQLEHSHDLWRTANSMRGPARTSLLKQRDQVVTEVCETVVDMGAKVDRFLLQRTQQSRSELAQLRQELNETMEAARRAEQRTAELEQSARHDLQQFEL